MAAPCKPPLGTIPGTGFNVVSVPDVAGSSYNNAADQLLYEIWQTLLLILAALGGGMTTKVVAFTIGDGQVGTPVAGTNSFVVAAFGGVNLGNVELLVLRNGIQLQYSNGVTALQIIRKNTGATGGFQFDAASGLTFQDGESYQLFVTGINNTIE